VRRAFLLICALGALAVRAGADTLPRRIASLNLTSDEVLVEILPPERLVGVTRWADDPETSNVAGRIPPSVYRFPKADMERLVALRPDLVIVSEYHDADFLRLFDTSGLRYHRMSGLDSLPGIRNAILALGKAVGASEGAERLVARFDDTLRDVGRRLAGAPRPRVLYWANPHTAGRNSAYGGLVECAGATNVGAELGLTGIVPLSAERAFQADPDYFLVGAWEHSKAALLEHPLLKQARAVRDNHVIEMPTALLVTLSHHAADSCRWLASALHPDRVPPLRP
jgi:ABC-type Fe3+-hydroxamate transport system substrate-binding protein